MRETEHAASTIRRRLAPLSSLYKHLVRHGHAAKNPIGKVERPAINRDEGSSLAFAAATTGEGGIVSCDVLMVHGHILCVPRLR
jgi:hypothetical protein